MKPVSVEINFSTTNAIYQDGDIYDFSDAIIDTLRSIEEKIGRILETGEIHKVTKGAAIATTLPITDVNGNTVGTVTVHYK